MERQGKNQINFKHQTLMKLKPHFRLIFGSKTSEQDFSQKNHFKSIVRLMLL